MEVSSSTWDIKTPFFACQLVGTKVDAARSLINLVNLQGPTQIALDPFETSLIEDEMLRFDPNSAWKLWWESNSGATIEFVKSEVESKNIPCFYVEKNPSNQGRCIGINVGGHFLRIVSINECRVEFSTTVRLGTGEKSLLSGASISDFVHLVRSHVDFGGADFIGIAWSAPRTSKGLRARSILMDFAGEIKERMEDGSLDRTLSKQFGLPVKSLNDGECVAAAELSNNPNVSGPTLILKLGTSMACGLAINEGVARLPMQGAKCLPFHEPQFRYVHPQTGMTGTIRDLVGATNLLAKFREITGQNAIFEDFCLAAVNGEDIAVQLTTGAVQGVTDLIRFVDSMLRAKLSVIVTGKNLEMPEYRALFTSKLENALVNHRLDTTVVEPECEEDLAAAIGAACIAQDIRNQNL